MLIQNPIHHDDPTITVPPGTPVNLTVSTGKDTHGNPCVIK